MRKIQMRVIKRMKIEESDIFNREKIAETMCKYIVETPADVISPVVLDGAWGCGKTTHAKRMRECFRRAYSDRVKCIYWNAAASDFASEPLPMFAAALYDSIAQENRDEFGKQAFTLCYGALASVAWSAFRQCIKNKTGVDIRQVMEEAEACAEHLDTRSAIVHQFDDFLKTAGDEKIRIDAASSIIQLAKAETQTLIVIIDELDRCRPDFALKMIECIKHLFDSAECKFVLVMNKMSMCSAITHLYGLDGEESEIYLSKYIKTDFQLPRNIISGPLRHSELCTRHYFYELLKKDGENSWQSNELLRHFGSYIIDKKGLQLREIEKLVNSMRFIQSTIPERHRHDYAVGNDVVACLVCFLAYLLCFEHGLAMQILSKETNTFHIIDALGGETGTAQYNIEKKFPCIKYIGFVLDYFFAKTDNDKAMVLASLGDFDYPEAIKAGGEVIEVWLSYATFMR